MDTHERLRQLLAERGWSVYRLAVKCGLSESTLANIFKRNKALSSGVNSTISFSAKNCDNVIPNPLHIDSRVATDGTLFDNWVNLTIEQKSAVKQLLKSIQNNKS